MDLSEKTVSVNPIVFEVSTMFIKISTDEIEKSIKDVLEGLGKYFNIDRAQIFEFDFGHEKINSIFSWNNEVINNQQEKFQNINLKDLAHWFEKFSRFEIVHYPDVTGYYDQIEGDVLLLRENRIKSLLVIPLINKDNLIGVMSFAAVKEYKTWSEEETVQLKFLSEIFTNALERKRAETQLDEINQLRKLIYENVNDALIIEDDNGKVLDMNKAARELFCTEDGFKFKSVSDFGFPSHTSDADLEQGSPQGKFIEITLLDHSGIEFPAEMTISPIKNNGKNLRLAVIRDIRERKKAHKKIADQMNYLAAGRKIDRMIMENRDLEMVLETLLDTAIEYLKVNAADIFLWDAKGQNNKIAIACGEDSEVLENGFHLVPPIKDCPIASGRSKFFISDLKSSPDFFSRSIDLIQSGFEGYLGIPLVSGNKVRGLFEIFLKKDLPDDPEWLELLDGFAWQILIAVDNSEMFWGLLQKNSEMTIAYDTTLEGWATALELRDFETGGHTYRVSDLTVNIASLMGIEAEELSHVYRGAILHDIGKLAIPDRILLKPGPLDEEERAYMQRHPEFAYEMLEDIDFLRKAIDIPYYHHEKWDGTGYPRGLAGEDIPLPARIFAVVDVFDALISDRPYRKGWPVEKALDYIRMDSGIHFDPEVVKVFIDYFKNIAGK